MKTKFSSKLPNCVNMLAAFGVLAMLGLNEVVGAPAQQAQPSPAEQFRKMQNTWDEQAHQRRDGDSSIRMAKPEEFIANYVALAEAHPKDPATCEAVLWLKNRFRKIAGVEKAEALARRRLDCVCVSTAWASAHPKIPAWARCPGSNAKAATAQTPSPHSKRFADFGVLRSPVIARRSRETV